MATSIFKEYFKGYEILGELGRGNARVLKGRNVRNGELVAIKHFAFNSEPDAIRRFQRESEIMKSIQHDNIVKIIEVHLDAELPYIVMQLVEGGDLRGLLKWERALDFPTVLKLAQHMTEALEAIHAKSVVHRDIKPENIMFRRLPDGELHFLLTDFGIAKLREQSDGITATGSSLLTYDYASPEQFGHSKNVSTATDYYSLGVVLYECLTGDVPFEFEQEDLLYHINRVIGAPVPAPRTPSGVRLPENLLQLLEGLLAKQSAARLTDPVEIKKLLRLAAIEDRQSDNKAKTNSKRQTLKYFSVPAGSPPPPAPKPKRHDYRFSIFVLLLIGTAVFFSWTNLVKSNSVLPLSEVISDNSVPAASDLKYTYPEGTELATLGKTSYMPDNIPVTSDASDASGETVTDPGISLPNGVYYNDFSDTQDSLWRPGKDENSEFKLADGKYVMTGLADSLSYSTSIKFDLDLDKDFSVSANGTHAGNNAGDPFGINFCGDEEGDAYFIFYITSNGFYSIGASVKGEWNVLVDWTETAHVRKDGELNILSVEKQADSLRFFINGKLEKVLPFTGGYGNYFGLRVDGAQTVSFDQFIVKGSH